MSDRDFLSSNERFAGMTAAEAEDLPVAERVRYWFDPPTRWDEGLDRAESAALACADELERQQQAFNTLYERAHMLEQELAKLRAAHEPPAVQASNPFAKRASMVEVTGGGKLPQLVLTFESVEDMRAASDFIRQPLPPKEIRTTDATLNAGLDKLRAIANGQVLKVSPLQARLILDYVRSAQPPADVERDAARWRALIGCARIRVMGSAGLHDPQSNYAHIGVEFWTHHKAQSNPRDIETILKFVERASVTKSEGAS